VHQPGANLQSGGSGFAINEDRRLHSEQCIAGGRSSFVPKATRYQPTSRNRGPNGLFEVGKHPFEA
jgi:hypothetical protein